MSALGLLAFAAAYLLGAGLGKWLQVIPGDAATLWLPSGIYMGCLLITRRSHWPRLVLAGLAVDVLASLAIYHFAVPVALSVAIANTAEALLGASLVRAFCPAPFHLHAPRNVFALVVLASMLAPALGATLGAATMAAAGIQAFANVWPIWWIGDGLGVLIGAPVLVSLWHARAHLHKDLWRRWPEALALLLTYVGLIHLVFSLDLPLVFLIIHPLLWAGLRFGVPGTTLTTALLALLTVRYVAAGYGPGTSGLTFATASVIVTFFLDVVSVAALTVASIMEQRTQMMRALRHSHDRLEEQVAMRTAALRESQSLFAAAFRLNPFPMALQTFPEGRYRDVSEACVTAFGHRRERMLGSTSAELQMYVDPAEREAVFQQLKANGRVRDVEVRLFSKAGGVRHYSFNGDIIVLNGEQHLLGLNIDITDRKRVEQALRESEERMQLALDAAEQGVWSLQPEAGQLQMDARGRRLHGLPEGSSERIYEEVRRSIPPEDLAAVDARFYRSRQTGTPFEAEYRVIMPAGHAQAGSVRWLSTVGRWNAPRTEVLGVVWDVTARRQAAQALRESEALLRELFEQSTTGIARTDLSGRFIAVNPRFCEMVGRSRESLLGLNVLDITHPEDLARCAHAFEALLRDGTPFLIEKRYLRPDGTAVDVHNSVARVMDAEHKQPLFIVGFTMDITERKQAEAALRESERRARRLIEANIVAVFTANEQHILEANDVFLNMVGHTRAELEAGLLDWRPLTPDEHVDSRTQALQQLIDQGRCEPYEKEFRRPDGSRVPMLIGAAVIQYQPLTWVSFAADLTLQKQAQQLLKDADRRKDQFLALLSHELRNPLAPLRNAVHILEQLGDAEPLLVKTRGMIGRQVAHLTRLVDDLLDVSRVTQGKIVLRRGVIALNDTLEAAVEMARPALEAKAHAFELRLSEEPLFVEGDTTRLTQVIGNLLNNATKFTPTGGHIELSVAREGAHAVLSVRDDGAGIDAAVLPHVFDLFAQGDRSLDRSQGGLGIGLSLVKSLVAMHGGSVEARSAGPGRGSEFVLRLPLAAAPPKRSTSTPPLDKPTLAAQPHRILVVDDNRDAADSMADMLAAGGNAVECAYDGSEALRTARRFHPDVVLLDIGLPEVDGYEVARRLREEPPSSRLLLVAVTGYGTVEDRKRSREAGFDYHLVKPVDGRTVSALIAEHRMP
jgi:PAS domain S-box-containing protein